MSDALADATPRIDTIEAVPQRLWAAQRRVTWAHYRALLDHGVPPQDLARGGFTFGVATIQGREMVVTEDARLRAYLTGPGLFALPGGGEDGRP